MSGVYKSFLHGTRNLGHILEKFPGYGQVLGAAAGAVDSGYNGTAPQAVPKPPTIDEAGQQTQEIDRIRRRKGVLANVFGGNKNSAVQVGTKQLLGGGS